MNGSRSLPGINEKKKTTFSVPVIKTILLIYCATRSKWQNGFSLTEHTVHLLRPLSVA